MKTRGKKALALLLSLLMIVSLFGGITIVGADGEEGAEASGGGLYLPVDTLTPGTENLLVAESDGQYYALTYDGTAFGAAEVTVGDKYATVNSNAADWLYDEDGYFSIGGTFLYPSSSRGLMTYSSGREISYENGNITWSTSAGADYLTFDGNAFGCVLSGGEGAAAAAIQLFVKTGQATAADAFTEGKEYALVTQYGDSYYAFGATAANTFIAKEVEITDDGSLVYTVEDDVVFWLYEDTYVKNIGMTLAGEEKPYLYPSGSVGLASYGSGRTVRYENGFFTWTTSAGEGYLTFDGTDFSYINGDNSTAAPITLYEREATQIEEPEDPIPEVYPAPEAIVKEAVKNDDGSITLGFTSDIHYDGKNLNLKTWLEASGIEYIDTFGSCGDMGSAYASNAEDFWTWTGAVMEYMDTLEEAGVVGDAVYTQGNHEWMSSAGGDFSNSYYEYDAAKRLKQVGELVVTDDYIVYAFGAGQVAINNTYDYNTHDIDTLREYLATAPADRPIFILTHFPLHRWESRTVKRAQQVVDALNSNPNLNIIVLWGHNHSNYDDYYFLPKFPGDEIVIDTKGTSCTINFTYLAAGCTADVEYTGPSAGSAATMNKGLIATINADGSIDYKYYTIDGMEMNIESPWMVRFRTGVDQYEVFETQYVNDGETVTAVEAPVMNGYDFVGWYYRDGGSEVEFSFDQPITRNTLVTAKYEKIILPVTEGAELDPGFVYVTIQNEQETAVGTSGKPIALYPIPYTEGMTIGDAFVKVHELEFEGGTEGVAVEDSGYGAYYLTKVWGHDPSYGSWIFDPNSTSCYVDANAEAEPGASYYALAYDSSWKSTSYMNAPKVETKVGETITMAAMTFAMDSSYNYSSEGMPGDVYCGTSLDDLAQTEISTEDGYFDISFDAAGEYIVVVKGANGDAMGFVSVEALVPAVYKQTDALEPGTDNLVVAEYEGKYYALTYDGSLGAVEVELVDGSTVLNSDNALVWTPDDANHLGSKYDPEQFIFAGSGGFMVYGSSMQRVFLYNADSQSVQLHTKYVLTFDGEKFNQSEDTAAAAKILIFQRFTGFTLTDTLEAGKEYVVVAEKDGSYYALTYDGSLGAQEVAVENDVVETEEDALVWLPDGEDHLGSKYDPEQFIFAGSGGFMVYGSSMQRVFLYNADSKTVKLHTKYVLTFDGEKFGQSETPADAATILLFSRTVPDEEEEKEPEPPVKYPQPDTVTRAAVKNDDGSITLAFTSDVHYDGQNLNLKTWLEAANVGYIDGFGFCGDMGSAYASSAEDFWTWTGAIMDYMDSLEEAGTVGNSIYTHGNHEWFPTAGGDFANEYENYPAATRLMQVGEGLVTEDYIIYCFGAGEISASFKYDYNDFDIAELKEYLDTAPTDIPIFILTHFPIHYWYGRGEERYMKHANEVIDVLNEHPNVVVLWGHNHSDFDDNYYAPRFPGEKIRINPEGDERTLNFTYLAAGCTADAEYTGPSAGSAATMNKGLVVTLKADGTMEYNYYTIDGEVMHIVSPWLVRFRDGVNYQVFNTQYVNDGETVAAVEEPAMNGYTFEGWVTWDTGSEAAFDFSAPITRNTLVTAKFEKIIPPVTEGVELDPGFVYVTIQNEQATAVGTSGAPIALYPIPYTEGMTIGDAFVKVHELEFEGGTEGVAVEDSGYGAYYLTKVWGHTPEHGSWIFDPNSTTAWIDASAEAEAGASYYTLAYDSSWKSTSYMNAPKVATKTGETITMAAMTFAMDSSYNYAAEGMPGDVYCGTSLDDLAQTDISTEDGYFDISFDAAGEYIVVVKGANGDAMGFVSVAGIVPAVYKQTDALEPGTDNLIVAEYEGKYYALTYDGSLGAAEVELVDGSTVLNSDNALVWTPDDANHLASKHTPEQFIFASSGGLTTWDSSMLRVFVYDAEAQAVALHDAKYYLAFDGAKFGQANSADGAAKILIFQRFTGFTLTDTLEAGKEYVVVAEKDGSYYALTYDGSLGAQAVTVENDVVETEEDALVWLPDGEDHLGSKYDPTKFIFAGSGGFMVYENSMLRVFLYNADSKTVKLHTKYVLTFDGEKFGQSETPADAATILLFSRTVPDEEEEKEPEPPVKYPQPDTVTRAAVKNDDGSITLAFTSDVHYDGVNLNLKTWLEAANVGYIDAFGFCGDMGSAYASDVEEYWTWTGAVMDYMDSLEEAGTVGNTIYTQGNHEWFTPYAGGGYGTEYANYAAAQRLMQVGEGLVTDAYIIYCFGCGSSADGTSVGGLDYDEVDIAELEEYLASAPTDKPIFILTHMPLHEWYGRSQERYMKHASEVIDVLNAGTASGHDITVLWGHNHSDFDDNYYAPRFPGAEIVIDPDGTTKTLDFIYLAAGCTADAEYTGPDAGSAATMNKGLVITLKADGTREYNYYTIDGEVMHIVSPWMVRFRDGVNYQLITSQYVEDGETAAVVAEPEFEGYTFGGWVTWNGGEEVDFDFAAPITKNTLVTAKFEKIIPPVTEAAERDPAYVYVTIEDEKAVAVGTSGKPIALYPVPYVEGMTIADAFTKVHELEFEGGTEGVSVYDTTYGFWSFEKLWGHTPANGALAFSLTSASCWIDAVAAAVPGEAYYALAYDSDWLSTSYMNSPSVKVKTGETVTMAAMTFSMDSSYNYAAVGMDGDVYCGTSLENLALTEVVTDDGYFNIVFDEPGEYIVVVKGAYGDAMGFASVADANVLNAVNDSDVHATCKLDGEGESISADLTLYNENAEKKTANVLLAVYDANGQMIDLKMETVEVDAGGSLDLSLSTDKTDADGLTLMVLDDVFGILTECRKVKTAELEPVTAPANA